MAGSVVQRDAGFAVPALYAYLERAHIAYTLGLATNERLDARAAPLAAQATQQRAQTVDLYAGRAGGYFPGSELSRCRFQ